jgi:hypothetical protein
MPVAADIGRAVFGIPVSDQIVVERRQAEVVAGELADEFVRKACTELVQNHSQLINCVGKRAWSASQSHIRFGENVAYGHAVKLCQLYNWRVVIHEITKWNRNVPLQQPCIVEIDIQLQRHELAAKCSRHGVDGVKQVGC